MIGILLITGTLTTPRPSTADDLPLVFQIICSSTTVIPLANMLTATPVIMCSHLNPMAKTAISSPVTAPAAMANSRPTHAEPET